MIGILGTLIVPMFVYVKAITACFLNPGTAMSLFSLYDDAFMFLMLLFAPMVLTVPSALFFLASLLRFGKQEMK